MVLAVEGVAPPAVRAMQALSSAGTWQEERRRHQHWHAVETALGADEGMLRVDGSDVPKQGVHALGVKRQACGALGKRAHGQAGVCVGAGTSQGDTMRERRVSVPAAWLADDA